MDNKIVMRLIAGILLFCMIGYTVPVFSYTKDETVYSKLDNSGDVYKTIVSTHLQNAEGLDLINDMSDLLDIKNTSGNESYTQDGNNIVWNANKNDIYYQGQSSKELPIECVVKYQLNGEEVSADQIVGKSGKVKIILQYINKEQRVIEIDGKSVKMYVPFVVVAGTFIENKNARNIEVSSGKVVDDGTKTVVVGIAMPGLQESLNLSDSDVNIPSCIEISMDATDFESDSIVSFVTPKVFDKDDLNVFDKLDDVFAQVNTLKSSSKKIEDGANSLKQGALTYSEKSQEFNGAMNKVSQGVSSVNSNYSKIDSGINSLSTGSSSLTAGAEQLNSGINDLSTKLSTLPESISKLYKGSSNLNAGVNGENGLVNGISALESSLDLTIQTLNSNIATLTNTRNVLINAGYKESDEVIVNLQKQITVDTMTVTKLTSKETQNKLSALQGGVTAISEGSKSLEKGLEQLDVAASQLPNALTQLSNGSKSLVSGSKSLKAGVGSLSEGSVTLKNGIKSLDTSTKSLTSANGLLVEGATTLADGATSLAQGIVTFNRDGVEKICDYVNGDFRDVSCRVERLVELAKDYSNFTMLNEGNDGNVKFIMIVEGVRKQQESELSKESVIFENGEDY